MPTAPERAKTRIAFPLRRPSPVPGAYGSHTQQTLTAALAFFKAENEKGGPLPAGTESDPGGRPAAIAGPAAATPAG